MKRFLILILFSLLFPMQNSSAAPSLEETIDFLVNGPNDSWVYERKHEWSIDDNCVLKIKRDAIKLSETYSMKRVDRIIYLNKVNLKKGVKWRKYFTGQEVGFILYGKDVVYDNAWAHEDKSYDGWAHENHIRSDRNLKALQHLFGNFCEGSKSAF
jgi:hypothetical protein